MFPIVYACLFELHDISYIYWLTDWWLMRFDENCWQTVFRLKLKLASEHRTRTEPPYANLIKTLCTLSCKMCKSKLKQHCQILPAYKDMKLETTLSELSCFSFEFTGFLGHVLIQWDMQLTSVDYVVWCWPVGAGGRCWQCLGGWRHGIAPWMGTCQCGQ